MLRSVRLNDASNKETKGQALRVVTDYRYSATGFALRSIAVGSSPGRCPGRMASPPWRRPGPARRTAAVPRDPRDPLSLAVRLPPCSPAPRSRLRRAAPRCATAGPVASGRGASRKVQPRLRRAEQRAPIYSERAGGQETAGREDRRRRRNAAMVARVDFGPHFACRIGPRASEFERRRTSALRCLGLVLRRHRSTRKPCYYVQRCGRGNCSPRCG